MRALSEVERRDLEERASARGYQRCVGGNVKGDGHIDWDDKTARASLLDRIVGDAHRLVNCPGGHRDYWRRRALSDNG